MSRSDWEDDFDDLDYDDDDWDNDDLDDDDLDEWDDDADDDGDECELEYAASRSDITKNYTPSAPAKKRRGCLWWCFVGWWWIPIKWVFIGLAYLYFILPYRLIKWLVKSAVRFVRGIKNKHYCRIGNDYQSGGDAE